MIDRRLWVLGALLAAVGSAYGQPSTEALSGWPIYLEVPLPEGGGPGLCDLIATPSMFTQSARPSLQDLRLYDARGREVPYAIRLRAPRSEFRAFAPKEFNRVSNPDGSVAVSLDLGEGVEEHNRVEVTGGGSDYRRAVRVEGGDDGKVWREVVEGELRFFSGEGQVFDQRAVTYPASRFRYLRVTVTPDKGKPDDRPGAIQVRVVKENRDPGMEVVSAAVLSEREPGRSTDGYTSQWMIGLPGGERTPWETLEFDADEREFSRSYRVEEATGDEPWSLLASGQWERRSGQTTPLRVKLSQRTVAAKLRLVVVDQRNPPLHLRLLTSKAAAEQILFQRTQEMAGPLRIYLGNASANAPGYDIGRTLAAVPVATQRAIPGDPQWNADYVLPPDSRSLLDRLPWVAPAVFGTVIAVLAGLLASTARQAIRRRDAKSTQSQ